MIEAALLKAIKYCNSSQRRLADLIGEDPDKISYWLNRAKKIPFHSAVAIEHATQGLVSRYDLAPYARLKNTTVDFSHQSKNILTISERVALGANIENALGNRKGKRSDRLENIADAKPGSKWSQVKGKSSHIAALEAGFNSRNTYLRAKKVISCGVYKLVQAMDAKKISIAVAAEIADLSLEEQEKILSYDANTIKFLINNKKQSEKNKQSFDKKYLLLIPLIASFINYISYFKGGT